MIIKSLLLLTVFLTPLLGATNTFGYEQIKVLFFIFSISLIGFLWIFRKPKLEWNLIRLASFLFILTLFVSSMIGIDPKNSLLGNDPYFQGWIVYAYLFLFSLIVSATSIKLKHYAIILTVSSVVVSALAIQDWVLLHFFHQMVPTYAGRVVSSFGQPNFYSGFILLTLPFWYFLLKEGKKRWVYLNTGFLISILAMLLSESKAAFLVFGILAVTWLILELRNNKHFILITIFAAIILAVFSSFYFKSGLFFEQITKPLNVSNLDRAHNYFLDLLLFSGILGLISWLILLFVVFKKLLTSRISLENNVLLSGLITYLIWVQFQNQSVVHLIYFWLLVGIIDQS